MSETEELQAEVERLRAHHTKMTRYDEGLVKSERRRAEAAEAEVERLKQGLYPLTQWTIEQATQLADRIGTSEGSLFVAWINERKRADAAEAQVERLTRECLDREATETDARERLRQAEERLDKVKAMHRLASDGQHCFTCVMPWHWPCPTASELQ